MGNVCASCGELGADVTCESESCSRMMHGPLKSRTKPVIIDNGDIRYILSCGSYNEAETWVCNGGCEGGTMEGTSPDATVREENQGCVLKAIDADERENSDSSDYDSCEIVICSKDSAIETTSTTKKPTAENQKTERPPAMEERRQEK